MSKQPLSARPRRNELREKAARERRQQNIFLAGAGVVLLLIIGAIVYVSIRNTLPVSGEESYTSQGNAHIPENTASPIVYNSTPPSSGPHYDGLAGWGIYDRPIRYEMLNHNLEDGGVVVYYQCPEGCAELVEQLTTLIQPHINAGRHVAMLPNQPGWSDGGSAVLHKDMEAKIALVAWGKLLKMDEVDEGRITRFIEKYQGLDHHVQGQG